MKKIIKIFLTFILAVGGVPIIFFTSTANSYVACSGAFVSATASFPKDVLFKISGDPCAGAQGIGAGDLKQPIGQTISNSDIVSGTIFGVEISLSKEGSPIDDVIISLRSDLLGEDLASAIISASSLPPHASYYTIQLPLDKSISTGNVRFLVVRRSGDLDTKNFADLRHADPGSYSNGGYFECSTASCPITPSYDVIFKLLGAKTASTPTPTPIPSPTSSPVYQSPQPSCDADTWSCGSWGSCSLSGIQNRSCTKTFDCPNVQTAPPTTDQYCEAPNKPTQQTPQNSSDEILNQDSIIRSSVKLICPVDEQKASQGSGTIIDPNGTILTNKHVIAGTLGCFVGFIDNFNDEPYFGDRQIADISKVSLNQDIAILKIRNPQNKKMTSIDIAKGNSDLRLGTKITIYGYPAKFGTKVTYTSGDFSGTDGSYFKTTAILEYGNSGGGAYLKDGTFMGIPSAVVKGQLNALGYILSINTINSWLGNSNITYGGTSNNNYSRVSVLEDMDLNKLSSLKLFIPNTDVKGNLSIPAAKPTPQNIKEPPQTNRTQKESIIVEPTDANNATNLEQNSLTLSERVNKRDIKAPEQRKSIVADAVQEMIKVAERNSGVGQQIKTIAQTANSNQEKLETGIQKIQSRNGFAKFFIGPNYGEIKNSQKLLEQNKEQIQELNQLRTQIADQGDQLQIVEQIQLIGQTNQEIENTLSEARKGFSLFGWIFKLFTR